MRLSLVIAILACSVLFSHAQEKRPGIHLRANGDRISAEAWARHTVDAVGEPILYLQPGPQHSVAILGGEKVFIPFDEFLPRCRDILSRHGYFLTPAGGKTWWVDNREAADGMATPVDLEQLVSAPPELRVWCAVYVGDQAPAFAGAIRSAAPGVRATAGRCTVTLTGRAADVRGALDVLRRHVLPCEQRGVFKIPPRVDPRELHIKLQTEQWFSPGRTATDVQRGYLFARGAAPDLDLLRQLLAALEK